MDMMNPAPIWDDNALDFIEMKAGSPRFTTAQRTSTPMDHPNKTSCGKWAARYIRDNPIRNNVRTIATQNQFRFARYARKPPTASESLACVEGMPYDDSVASSLTPLIQ
jgi:hypothetical protein